MTLQVLVEESLSKGCIVAASIFLMVLSIIELFEVPYLYGENCGRSGGVELQSHDSCVEEVLE